MNSVLTWIAAALVVVSVGAVAGIENGPTPSNVLHEPAAIPDGVCQRGHVGVWIDSNTMECLKELP